MKSLIKALVQLHFWFLFAYFVSASFMARHSFSTKGLIHRHLMGAGPSPVFRSKRLKIKRLAIREHLVAFLFGSQPVRCHAASMAVSGGWRRSETSLRSSLPLRSACGPLPFTWPRAATVSRAASASGTLGAVKVAEFGNND